MFFFFSIFFFFSFNQFVLVVVSYFIGGGGFVSAAKLGRARLCVSLRRYRGVSTNEFARRVQTTRRAKGKTILVNESDRVYRQCLPEQGQIR